MSEGPVLTPRNRWFTASVLLTVSLVIIAALIGFIWLPSVHPDAPFQGVWNAICSAAGVPRAWVQAEAPVHPTLPVSEVVVTPQMLQRASSASIGRGATLAHRCAICHGVRTPAQADTPDLAGQPTAATYKQLQDFRTGARVNAVMSPMAVDLTDRDIADLAAYYAYLPRVPAYRPAAALPAPRIVASGAPMRNIAPCGACHGGMEFKAGAPWLGGQSANYLLAQLQAFAGGARHNDIGEQMRNVARQITPPEMVEAARYYDSQP